MSKRKKHPRLPSGFGTIRYLGKGRSCPYAVHPPATDRDDKGTYIRPNALCYVEDWYTAFAVLSAYRAGTYKPGIEATFRTEVEGSTADLDSFCRRLIRQQTALSRSDFGLSFEEVYLSFTEWKFGENAAKKLSGSSKYTYAQGWKYLSKLKDVPINSITLDQLQNIVNECDKKKGSRSNIVLTAKQIYKFAVPRNMVDKDVAQYLTVPDGRENEKGVPFSDDELRVLWNNSSDDTIQMLLIMCYSGFRIGAFETLEVNLEEGYFRGGLKTAAGKNRVVPIHSAILPFVQDRIQKHGKILTFNAEYFRAKKMYPTLERLGLERHTPHDCRHTFSRLCEKFGVREADRKRMMGHSFGSDITNAVYGHRTLQELHEEIEKIIPAYL